MNRDELRRTLTRDEGPGPMKNGRHLPYTDTAGKITIGFGRNLTDRGISMAEASLFLDHDIDDATKGVLAKYPWANALEPARQGVLINMAFNMGLMALSGFTQTLPLIEHGQYEAAAIRMLQSRWAEQTGDRALRLAEQLRRGEWI